MSKENQKLSYNELIDELVQLCSTKSTGTMFIVSDVGHSSRISLKDGDIIFFAYRTSKGLDALFDLYDINSAKYHFSKGVYNPYNILELPDTSELLQHFKLKTFPGKIDSGNINHSENSVSINNSLNEVSDTLNNTSKPVAEFATDQVVVIIDKIEASLINYLGPFADIAIHDYLADNKRPESQAEFRNMIDFLILEIDDRNDQTSFKNETIKIISR